MADSARLRPRLRKPGRTAYDDGRLRITRAGRRPVLAIAGVINEHNRAGLVSALGKLTAGQREIHISMRDVISCELAGLRAIILLAGVNSEAGDAARMVVLHEVPQHLTTILRILGWDCAPGLVIAEPSRPRKLTPPSDQAPMAGSRPAARPSRSPVRSSSAGQPPPGLVPRSSEARSSLPRLGPLR